MFDDTGEKTRVTERINFDSTDSAEDALVLIYPSGSDMGRKYELKNEPVFLGRDTANEIVVDSDSVSRKHAKLTFENGKRVIVDLGSTNGTYVNNCLIVSQFLENQDQVKLGDTIFKYLVGSDVETAYHEEIFQMTIMDGLTGIYNKRFFLESLEKELSRSMRYGRSLSLIMFDLDYFKKVNDTFGHLAGDYVLQSLAKLISDRSRREEIFARYGGEEFIILMPETQSEGALKLAEQLRKRVSSYSFSFEGDDIPLTISIGVATITGGKVTADQFIKMADEQLYKAKSDGRNCVRG